MSKKSLVVGIIMCIFVILFITKPTELISSAAEGMIICSKIIIPSLFPFTAVILLLFNCGFFNMFSKLVTPISRTLFGLGGDAFFAVIMSFIGGYPVGTKLAEKLLENNMISQNTAKRLLYYSVNPGPAFVIIGIGKAIFNRTDIGFVIYFSNIIASLTVSFLCSFIERKEPLITNSFVKKRDALSDLFVKSVADASESIISICGYVILFSSIIGIIESAFKGISIKPMLAILEVSNGTVLYKDNIYVLSFLTSFSGLSVHAQILSQCKNIKINYLKFLTARMLNGTISTFTTYILIKIFRVSFETFSMVKDYKIEIGSGTLILSASIIFMSLTLLVSIKQKYVEKNK